MIRGLVVLVIVSCVIETTSAQSIQVGQMVGEIALKQIAGHDAPEKLSKLRGHPVIFGSWISNSQSGVPIFIDLVKLMEKYAGHGLRSVLVDRIAWEKDDDARFVRSIGLSTNAIARPWGVPELNLPFKSFADNKNYLSVALVSVDGKLLIEGNINEIKPELTRLIAEQVALCKSGWGESKKVKFVRSLAYSNGELGKACKSIKRLKISASEKKSLEAEFEDLFKRRFEGINDLIEEGRFKEAKRDFVKLEKQTNFISRWKKKIRIQRKIVFSPNFKNGLKAEVTLEKILKATVATPQSKEVLARLNDFAVKCKIKSLCNRARNEALFVEYLIRMNNKGH